MTPTDRFRADLAAHFREQEQFADGYSPLYRRLFGVVAGILENDPSSTAAIWLVEAAGGRAAFDVTLLLPAALHREVLDAAAGAYAHPAVAALARFYPSAGGQSPAEGDPAFDAALLAALVATADRLGPFLQASTVQTNETARGLAWLLPAALTGWERINLVELGASAGLNLVAEQRAFRLIDGNAGTTRLEIGLGRQPQFTTRVEGPDLLPLTLQPTALPHPVTRTGGDVAPFRLETAADERALAAFVWADQPARLDRLREGMAALRHAQRGPSPVHLLALNLPAGLPAFMERVTAANPPLPTVVYNTTMSMYLEGKAARLRQVMTDWAGQSPQPSPLLWLQWEPAHEADALPPANGWLAWTADLWAGGEHTRFRLAWVHPHGTALRWEPGVTEFAENLRKP